VQPKLGERIYDGALGSAGFLCEAYELPKEDPSEAHDRAGSHPSASDRRIDLLSDIPSYEDHAGGRLALGPDQKLYLTVGDRADNHMTNVCEPNRAQDLPSAADVTSRVWVT
jgi:glucose/arabinose dehydrogenase